MLIFVAGPVTATAAGATAAGMAAGLAVALMAPTFSAERRPASAVAARMILLEVMMGLPS
jgi:hypothetical protein